MIYNLFSLFIIYYKKNKKIKHIIYFNDLIYNDLIYNDLIYNDLIYNIL